MDRITLLGKPLEYWRTERRNHEYYAAVWTEEAKYNRENPKSPVTLPDVDADVYRAILETADEMIAEGQRPTAKAVHGAIVDQGVYDGKYRAFAYLYAALGAVVPSLIVRASQMN